MGCICSKDEDTGIETSAAASGTRKRDSHLLKHRESRIETAQESKTAVLGGLKIRYAYLSQRGYYPDDADKPNQDAYADIPGFSGNQDDQFFAVFDGHGRDGDKCAQFAAKSLPMFVSKYVEKLKLKEEQKQEALSSKQIELSKDQLQAACLTAHVQCNRAMHKRKDFDDSLSGTTAISCFIHGARNRITISNVGDSRAILGQGGLKNSTSDDDRNKNKTSANIRALPLSRDQTPYRRDERTRIRATGARILSLDQMEGLEPINDEVTGIDTTWDDDIVLGEEIDEGGDPPRVWSPDGEYPGTAFTRSLGDVIAEELGVSAEPEMVTRELNKDDKIIVLASDGVFEFLTNQSVMDICAKFKDPLEACRAVVAESYELWLQYELRTDDITMVCIFIDSVDTSVSRSSLLKKSIINFENTTGDNVDAMPSEDTKPVRKYISIEKTKQLETMRESMIHDIGDELEQDFDLTDLFTEKSDDDKLLIGEAIKASIIFQNISKNQRELIYGVMEPINVKKGDWIIRQGTVGDRFYIIDHGQFEVRIVPEGEEDTNGNGGNTVHVYCGSRDTNAHPCFGELALMYSAPRAASILAQTDGQLWGLHRYAFKKILASGERLGLSKVLKDIDVFDKMEAEKLENIVSSFEEITIGRGETIVKQGDASEYFYVIASGACDMTIINDGEETKTRLKANDYFAQEVLSSESSKYSATVVTVSLTTFLKIKKLVVNRLVN
eukprot:CAMPEP_0197826960 /NCGR_PEP_ID=MMETSP1437-20131217/3835_1 /TAXON_ID=49252 ORGANISM="Eucampia antarctica, Strain CCMP1452" /NCGR_SAMPLE_ID=MMETSP1437 /ASSEMBLY_ACC=CAM_ASM_001096 /LENGTH=725 /DNA_ID=CAMNT_0043427619 /DNA_START=65 /DNA_END=2242 /DNA_ORIENTATION=+